MSRETPLDTKTVGRLTVNVYPDDSPSNPREDDNLGEILYTSSRYNLGDKRMDADEIRRLVGGRPPGKIVRGMLWLPVYCYMHSCTLLSTKPFGGRAQHAEWDSGCSGVVLATRARAKALGTTWASKNVAAQLVAEVDAFSKYLNGEYVGFTIEDEAGEVLQSCWGYDDADFAMSEGVVTAEYLVKRDNLAGVPEREAALVRALREGADAADEVEARWESGDLAGAVNALTAWAAEARDALKPYEAPAVAPEASNTETPAHAAP